MRVAQLSKSFYPVCVAGAVLAAGAPARAADEPLPDKSGFTLFNPTPRELMREMSTDRPDTTESAYTVDAGHFQLEMSALDFTCDRRNEAGETVRALAVAPMLLKIGLLNHVDLQIGLDPFTAVRTEDRASGEVGRAEGFGDTTLRLKINLWGNDGGTTALAVMPFVVLPTAQDGLGVEGVEGGVIVPLAIDLGDGWSMGLMLEVDLLREEDGGTAVDLLHTATVSRPLWGELGGFVEYAGFAMLEGDEEYRGYFDAGLTYALSEDLVLDGGIRVGLTRAADDFGVFAGVSLRF